MASSEARFHTLVSAATDIVWHADVRGEPIGENLSWRQFTGQTMEEVSVGRWLAAVHPEDRARAFGAFSQAMAERRPYESEYRLRRHDGEWRHIVSRGVPILEDDGAIREWIGACEDITKRRQDEDEVCSRARQQTAVAELSRRALIGEPLPVFFEAAVGLVARTLAVEFSKVLELLPDGSGLKLVAGVGWREGLVGHAVVGVKLDSQAGYTLEHEQPVVVEDLRTETRFRGPALLCDHGVVSGLSVQIGGAGKAWGVLGAHTARSRSFTNDDVDFVRTMADLLGTAIARRATEAALLDAEDAERRRIAKELHDSTAQDLIAVILNLETLREAARARDPAEAKRLEDSIALPENSAHEIRTLSYLLHPPRLDEAGLPGAIRQYLAGFGERTGLVTHVDLPAVGLRLDEVVELTLFRVVQESLGNIYRHARSSSATVRLAREGGEVVLEIRDEGHGIPPQVLAPSTEQHSGLGVGLPAMRERVRQVGGRLEINSTPHGTTVRAVVPAEEGPP